MTSLSLLQTTVPTTIAIIRDAPTVIASSILSNPVIGIDAPTATNTAATTITTTTTAMASLVATSALSLANAAATATATATAMSSSTADDPDDGGSGECRLLGPFALIVQVALGGLALLSLVYKRWRERPQRPLKIWFFDVSKQVVGASLVHVANVFMSILTSGKVSVKLDPTSVPIVQRLLRRGEDDFVPNPCSLYLLNLGIDTTIGIPILLILLKVVTGLVAYTSWGNPRESIQSGNYGHPPNPYWWLKQSVIYFCGLFGMKICVLIIFLILPWISRIGDWALKWTEGNERLQIVFVMMLFPLIMNALQYYIIDSFIKLKETNTHERLPTTESEGDRDPFDDALVESDDEGSTSGESSESVRLAKTKYFKDPGRTTRRDEHEEYDPDRDGSTTTARPGSSRERGSLLNKELVPPE